MASHADLTADVLFSSTYRADPNIAITYNSGAGTCSAVSCHGGQTTPDWKAPNSINVASACSMCHEAGTGPSPVTPQYNSYYSGYHTSHLTGFANNIYKVLNSGVSIACTNCHNPVTLSLKHFVGLDTPALDPAGDTVGGTTKLTAYDKSLKTCTQSCHIVPRGSWSP